MKQRVVFLDRGSLRARVRALACAEHYTEFESTVPELVLERLATASVAITNKVPLRAAELSQLPNLRMIAVAATGYDCVDVGYCREHGIAVSNIRNYARYTVPEHTFALILALRRNLLAYRAEIEAGAWQQAPQFCILTHEIRDLRGSMIGIVGEGVLGRGVAALATAFGMHPVFAAHPLLQADDLESIPLPQLLTSADIVSLHCPLSAQTRHMIGAPQLRSMKRDALLINTARGGLVDEAALVQALEQGWIAGAGFDVLSSEPPRQGNPLLELRRHNFVLTPHVGWASGSAMQILADQLADNIDRWAAGTPQHLLTA